MPISAVLFDVPSSVAEVEQVRMMGATGFQQFGHALPFPFPYLLVLIGIGYLGLLGVIWLIYHLRRRRVIGKTRPLVQLPQFPCSTCCVSFAELCNCCRMTSLDACLNGLCPQRRVSFKFAANSLVMVLLFQSDE
ncbi:hypothetical protein PHET_07983 [Paragonimus heterotremus]|uniref:Uncharacterized protein n=1 Tax=Paragonimus heterotremus TaxID=100268 RepID=A0A8J4WPL1_9TREM|nr:hypothetical protein PHET_07983 [Paragonimus heterotremus]